MALSKKHYEMIAEEIKAEVRVAQAVNTRSALLSLKALAERLCVRFEHENADFKRRLFLHACGF